MIADVKLTALAVDYDGTIAQDDYRQRADHDGGRLPRRGRAG